MNWLIFVITLVVTLAIVSVVGALDHGRDKCEFCGTRLTRWR